MVTVKEMNKEKEEEEEEKEEYKRVQTSTKEEQTVTVLLDLTRLSMLLHYYYNISLIETKGQQNERLLPTHPSLQPELARRRNDNIRKMRATKEYKERTDNNSSTRSNEAFLGTILY